MILSLISNPILLSALIGAGIVVLLGSYSYLRNIVVMGNPSYPASISIGDRVLPGLYTASREWRQSHPFYPFDWAGFFGFGKRFFFGWTVPLFILPGLLLNVLYATAYLISILVRWPLIGVIIGPTLGGEGTAWRKDPHAMRAYTRASWVWVWVSPSPPAARHGPRTSVAAPSASEPPLPPRVVRSVCRPRP